MTVLTGQLQSHMQKFTLEEKKGQDLLVRYISFPLLPKQVITT